MKEKSSTNQEKYNEFLRNIVEERLFETGANLNSALGEKFTVSSSNARKIVSRAVDQKAIKSSYPYTFGKGQYLYLPINKDLDLAMIMKATRKNRPPVYRLLALLQRNNGIVSYYEAIKITAATSEDSTTKVDSLKDILNLLKSLEIIIEKKDTNGVIYIILKNHENTKEIFHPLLMSSHFSKMVLDCSILPDILRWLGRTNLIDNQTFLYRNKKTPHKGIKHNKLLWDAIAYTKTTGINDILGVKATSKEKQTLVVLDVVLADEYSDIHFDAFMSRIQINRNSVNGHARRVMPIIVYQSCSEKTLNTIRKNGILTYDIGTIFGARIYSVIHSFSSLFEGVVSGTPIDKNIEKILTGIRESGQEDALRELRGTLFEFLMYPVLKTIYPNSAIDRGKKITIIDEKTHERVTYEYDYIINSQNPPELIFVELKGYNAGATIPLGDTQTKASLKWFFRKTLPIAIKENQKIIDDGKKPKAVFITSANFWDDGKEFIETMNSSIFRSKHLEIGYERTGLIKLLNSYNFTNEIKVLEKFYGKPSNPAMQEDEQ